MTEQIKIEFLPNGGTNCLKEDPESSSNKVKESTDLLEAQHGFCRCCLSQAEFETENKNNVTECGTDFYLKILNETFNLNLDSKHTKYVCSVCADFLLQAYHFRQEVVNSEKILNEKLLKLIIKTETKKVDNLPKTSDDNKNDGKFDTKTDPILKVEIESDFYDEMDISLDKLKDAAKKKCKTRTKKYKCEFCNAGFNTGKQKGRHTTKKHLTCNNCQNVFSTMSERDDHSKSHTTSTVRCNVCDEVFENNNVRRRHEHAKHGLKCKMCNVFIPAQNKYKHDVEMHGAEPFKCGVCDKNFYRMFKLVVHQRKVHMNERNAPCSVCDFVAFDANNLRKHMLSHTAEKVHQCEYCNKRFARKDTLKFHLRIHTGDKRQVCRYCGEAFVQRASLKYHLEKYHPGDFY